MDKESWTINRLSHTWWLFYNFQKPSKFLNEMHGLKYGLIQIPLESKDFLLTLVVLENRHDNLK